MVTVILPFDKRCIDFTFKGSGVEFIRAQEYKVVDMFFGQEISRFTKIEFRGEQQYLDYINIITKFTDLVVSNQDATLIDDGSFFYGLDVLCALDEIDIEFNESTGYRQVPRDKKLFLEFIITSNYNKIDEESFLAHFELLDSGLIRPNFLYDSELSGPEYIINMSDNNLIANLKRYENLLPKGVNLHKPKLIDQLDSFGKIVNLEKKIKNVSEQKLSLNTDSAQPSNNKNNHIWVYIVAGGLWLIFLWNAFFKYLDTTSASLAIVLISMGVIYLRINNSKD